MLVKVGRAWQCVAGTFRVAEDVQGLRVTPLILLILAIYTEQDTKVCLDEDMS